MTLVLAGISFVLPSLSWYLLPESSLFSLVLFSANIQVTIAYHTPGKVVSGHDSF